MNKITLVLLLSGILINVSMFGQFRPGDIGYNSAQFDAYKKNKVKTQTQVMRDEDSITTRVSITEFTEDGWLIRTTFDNGEPAYDEEPIDTMKDEYTYFPDGRIRIITMFGYDLFPMTLGFEYDKKDNLVTSIFASAESRENTYEYDKSGTIIKRVGKSARFEVDAEGNYLDKMIMVETDFSTYTWDAKNRLTEELFSMNGEFYNRMVYSYNDKNQLTEMKAFYDTAPDAIPVFSTTYFYFENGLPKNMITIEDGFRVEHYYEYTFFN